MAVPAVVRTKQSGWVRRVAAGPSRPSSMPDSPHSRPAAKTRPTLSQQR